MSSNLNPIWAFAINLQRFKFLYTLNVRSIIHLLKKLFLLKIIIKYEPKN